MSSVSDIFESDGLNCHFFLSKKPIITSIKVFVDEIATEYTNYFEGINCVICI